MKFNFKIQQYQTDAVESVVKVFSGQKYSDKLSYIRDIGKFTSAQQFSMIAQNQIEKMEYHYDMTDFGYRNEGVMLTEDELLKNIHKIQSENNIKLQNKLNSDLGCCSLDVEMETGTGKTYVYIKTIFELNKRYGWNKFIIIVPSIAIREGVKKTFEMTREHFRLHYKKDAVAFIYDSSNLKLIDEFSQGSGINVMIINRQAFARSFEKKDDKKKTKEQLIIYDERDEFGSRKPIDVIAANRPILILDEPQKLGKKGSITYKAMKLFNPLFSLNYSATHLEEHNKVYVLDALDAYNKKLVKKIEVKGIETKNLSGANRYLYLEDIILDHNKPPRAKIELEINRKSDIKREKRILDVGDSLYYASEKLEPYKDYTISEIDPNNKTVYFSNGDKISAGDVVNDISEETKRRIQIRQTIISHFQKEKLLFDKGIKTLSLFFIDEVAKYRQYDDDQEILGEYGKIFEEEYMDILKDYMDSENTPYQKYLKTMCSDPSEVHKGYFSKDKNKHIIDSKIKRGNDFSDDISAYELILKNKEKLLSLDEPTRFIFSHSALREGWDNPNVFQICTLKHSYSNTTKRQEVGRGLRLCVNQNGNRMDFKTCGDDMHEINKLTVIADESYESFVGELQDDIKKVLRERATLATVDYFTGKYVKVDDDPVEIDSDIANKIDHYLVHNGYVDENHKITDKYLNDVQNKTCVPMPEALKPMEEGIHNLIQSIYDEKIFDDMFEDGNKTKIKENPLNENFAKKEFQELWNEINHKYAYTVEFESEELIKNSIQAINEKLFVQEVQYKVTVGVQKDKLDKYDLESGESFVKESAGVYKVENINSSSVPYDLLGKIVEKTVLTRKTIANILSGIKSEKFNMFKVSPEEFITKVSKLINEQKATIIVEHVSYNQTEDKYDSSIFTAEKNVKSFDKAFKAKKSIQDYIFTDGLAEKSIEKQFAEDLDIADEVCVYAKLPRGFKIPTPVGNYSPDWAIAFNKDTVKHIFFIAETKGTMDSLNIRPIEKAKIECAKKLFNEMSTSKVKYHDVDSYQNLLGIMNTL